MPKGAEILMLNAAREGKGRFDSVLEDAATETAAINPESENRSEIVATVATVAPAAFEATRLPGVVLGIAAIWIPRHLPPIGAPLNRRFQMTIQSTHKIGHKAREITTEVQEQVLDMITELRADRVLNLRTSKSALSANEGVS
jgi:hypothetical protein